jgi:hypothetical protein
MRLDEEIIIFYVMEYSVMIKKNDVIGLGM